MAGLLFVSLAILGGQAEDQSITWWTTHALEKVRPLDSIPSRASHSVELWAAQNEFEPFQIVFRAERQDLTGVDVEVTDLEGTQGTVASRDNITTYLESFIHVCSWCQKIAVDDHWLRIDDYFTRMTGKDVSHGICPECAREVVKALESKPAAAPPPPKE